MKMFFPGYIRYFADFIRIHSRDSWFNALSGIVFVRVHPGHSWLMHHLGDPSAVAIYLPVDFPDRLLRIPSPENFTKTTGISVIPDFSMR